MLTAGYDPLVDEGRAYAKRLVNEGVTSEHVEYADMVHGFITMGRVLDTANAAVDRCARALTLAWGLPSRSMFTRENRPASVLTLCHGQSRRVP